MMTTLPKVSIYGMFAEQIRTNILSVYTKLILRLTFSGQTFPKLLGGVRAKRQKHYARCRQEIVHYDLP